MNQDNALKQVAAMAKIADRYVSAWGSEAQVEDDTIRRLLASLGYDTSSDEALLQSAEKKHKKMWWIQYSLFIKVRRSKSRSTLA